MVAVNLDSVFTSKLYFKEERWYGFLPVHLNKELYILIRAEVASVIVEMSPEMLKKASMLSIFFATLKASQRDRFGRPRNGPPSTYATMAASTSRCHSPYKVHSVGTAWSAFTR
jgi:hypothetical protein